ncbi:AcrR family transcriptional regulator [Kibdelosporangium banguiense]|uniref:AcrR family transcriptional regulator n=1 Tax=Kibdelosporangium banguiense TaxID=1365924 RepID=A0ABS4TBL0_9PSEU|nr:TetR/AcrR family transcriptional regulator [Kibdelosporangium banguiense]MBP2321711.1 AcrR family transcriptional regulator [Kibdelosporangium banguiense]
MPRQVDHEERRQKIAEALWRIVSTQGLEGVSLRNVATEAGISMGLVQHYFSSKDDMLLFAFDMLSTRVETRLRTAQPQGPPIRDIFLQMLPLDDERLAEAHVAVAFMARAAVSPAFAEATRVQSPEFREYLAGLLRADGLSNADEHVTILLAALDGMTVHILAGQLTPEAAVQALDIHLEQLGHRPSPSRPPQPNK